MLTTEIFLNDFKIPRVKPLYKKTESFLFNSYSPISLLSIISKVFEKIIQSQVIYYFTSNNLLFKYQYGVRPEHSTEHAAVQLHDYNILHYPDLSKTPFNIFIYLSIDLLIYHRS